MIIILYKFYKGYLKARAYLLAYYNILYFDGKRQDRYIIYFEVLSALFCCYYPLNSIFWLYLILEKTHK